MDSVRKIDRQLLQHRQDLGAIEQRLGDETLYTDSGRKVEMTQLLVRQAGLKSALETLEWEWLEASEQLENAEKAL
jgi:ATP-binding cassette subfamily F protein 3